MSFYCLPQLSNLCLANNSIRYLEKDTFTGMPVVAFIDVAGNKLWFVHESLFVSSPASLTIIVDQIGICCFLVKNQLCNTYGNPKVAPCRNMLGQHVYRIPYLVIGLSILLGNLIVISYNIIKHKSKMSFRLVYLHTVDSLIGLVVLVLSAVDMLMNKQFNIQKMDWVDSIQCRLIGALGIFAAETSLITTMVIAAERYIIICYPFEAATVVSRLFIPLNFYWIILILFAALQSSCFTPQNPFCFHYISGEVEIKFILISIAHMIVNFVAMLAMLYLTHHSLKTAFQTRSACGRSASKQDMHMENRMRICTIASFCNWILISGFVISWMALTELPSPIMEAYILFIWPLSALINPIIYTV